MLYLWTIPRPVILRNLRPDAFERLRQADHRPAPDQTSAETARDFDKAEGHVMKQGLQKADTAGSSR